MQEARAHPNRTLEGQNPTAEGSDVRPAQDQLAVATQALAQAAALSTSPELHQLIDALPAAIYTTDAEGRLTHFNRAAVELSGRVPVIGSDRWCVTWKLYRPDGSFLPHDECPMALAVREGRSIQGAEVIAERPDGSRVWLTPYPMPLCDSAGKVIGGINLLVNITGRKNAEQERDHERELFRSIVERIPVMITQYDPRVNVLMLNREFERVVGWSADEAATQSIMELCYPDPAYREQVYQFMMSGSDAWMDVWMRTREGHDIQTSWANIRLSDGIQVGIGIDITRRKEIEESLSRRVREQAALYRFTDRLQRAGALSDVYEASLDAICEALNCSRGSILLCDDTDVMRFVAWRGLSDAYRAAVEGHSPWPARARDAEPVCVNDVEAAPLSDELKAVVRREGIAALVFIPLSAEGELFGKFMAYYDRPHHFTDADRDLALTIARQLAFSLERHRAEEERRQAAQALLEADRRKDEFLATLAHELRNPLAPIRNSLEIIKRVDDPALLKRARDTIERQTDQLVRLVDDLLDVSRISRNKLELSLERVELSQVVLNALETSGPLVTAAGQQLIMDLPPEPVFLHADPLRLAQVFSNLLNNAAKYSERGGTITFAVERQDREVVVRVRDTGIGIPPHMLPRIFEMFVQGDRSLERSRGGLGIGLTLVQRLVAMHGGQVEAHSEGVGKGSEFVVRLPLMPFPEHGTATPSAEAPELATRLNILIADDNQDAADSLAHLLSLEQHQVQVAYDGVDALRRVAERRPDVVLLDLGMPKLNGYDAARRIHAHCSGGKRPVLIALTGWGQEQDRLRTQEAGFDYHLVKPVDLLNLQRLLADVEHTELQPLIG